MNFNWRNSAKWGAVAGCIFFLLNTFGDYMILGNSIYKEFYTISFYKPLIGIIILCSLSWILFDWIVSLFVKRYFNKKNL